MRTLNYKWIIMLASLILAGMTGCSDFQSDLTKLSTQADGVTRAYDYSCTLDIEEPGTLDSLLVAKMGADSSNVQELILSGVFSSEDASYIRNNLSGTLARIDLSGITSFKEQEYYWDDDDNYVYDWKDSEGLWENCFYRMRNLEEVIFPENGMEKIGSRAFRECSSLKSFDIPATVTTIGDEAFEECTSLTSVYIPANVTSLGSDMFYDDDAITSANIQASVEHLPSNFFDYCRALTQVELSDSIKSFGSRAFRHCSSLDDERLYKGYDVTAEYIFEDTGYTEVDLSHLTVIPTGIFQDSKKLQKVTFSPNLTKIEFAAFYGCSALSDFTLPDKLEKIDAYAFSSVCCKELILPESLKEIGYNAFSGANISTIYVDSSLESVGWDAFGGISNLSAIVWNSPSEVADAVSTGNSNCLLYLKTFDGLAPAFDYNIRNVVIDGVAENIVLQADNRYSFNCPQAFTAKKISYSKDFNDNSWYHYTALGAASNWQTIVLPFAPDKVSHAEKGLLAPFNSEAKDAKPFWLRELTESGYENRSKMEADHAYIISMPNNPDLYQDEYNIVGTVTFSAENVEIPVTPSLTPCVGPDYTLYPNYSYMEGSDDYYVMDTNQWDDEYNKYVSAFRTGSTVYPFQAYATSPSARSVISLDGKRTSTRAAKKEDSRLKHPGRPRIDDI
jgi:hypothetical protein